jgi:hypothetical protein
MMVVEVNDIPDYRGHMGMARFADIIEATSELAESSVIIERDFTVDEAEDVGLRIDMPRFPKTLLAVRRLLLGCLDPTRPLDIPSEVECLSLFRKRSFARFSFGPPGSHPIS